MLNLLANWTALELLELHTYLNRHEVFFKEPAIHIIGSVQCLGTHEDPSGVMIRSDISHDAHGNPLKISHKQGLLLAHWLGVADMMRRPGATHRFYLHQLNGHFRNAIIEKVSELLPSVSMGLDDGARNVTHDDRHEEMVRLLAGSGLPRVRLRGKDMATFTYAIRGGDAVKIGKTQNIKQRLGQLQTSSPTKLELLYFFEQDYEREFHQALAPHRQSGEWFEWNEHTEAFLGQMVAERDGVSGREAFNMSALLA